jgi:hypothetical protein
MADALVDMAFSKDELKDKGKSEPCCVGMDGQPNPYPWGLSLHLERDSLDKLAIKQLPTIGTVMRVVAMVKVTSVNQSAREGESDTASVGLQITRMQIVPTAGENQG